jgi:predicted acetyltransferase
MELVFPTIKHKQAALEYLQEHYSNGEESIHGGGGLNRYSEYENWLLKLEDDLAREVTEERVPASTYFGVVDDEVVGMINIRHKLNKRLLDTYGHIGYGVRPSQRRKGYATIMLKLALEKCRELGIEKVLITCDKDNIASAKTITNNGGIPYSEFTEEDGSTSKQYWITL